MLVQISGYNFSDHGAYMQEFGTAKPKKKKKKHADVFSAPLNN